MRFSAFRLALESLRGHKGWGEQWSSPELQNEYEIVIVGGGGHGLATAYYLAKEFGYRRVAVLEKGWLGGGNTGRNTTIVRSNYLMPESLRLYDHALNLWEKLSFELNYNVMFSPRGVMHIYHDEHDLRETRRRGHSIGSSGVDWEFMSPDEVKKKIPLINLYGRFPILGGLFQPRAGVARHDAVAWGYARAASNLGVDIIENCEVTGFKIRRGKVIGLETTKGKVKVGKVGLVTAGNSSRMSELAGFRLPIVINTLQALVSEPVKPMLDTVVMSNGVHGYISQSDKGELVIGGGTDLYTSYSQRGSEGWLSDTVAAIIELFPCVLKMRMLRIWGGAVDVTADRSPIISKTSVENLYVNCGWGTGGFKATPGSGQVFAESLAKGEMSDIAAPFSIDRFRNANLVDEGAASGVSH